LGSRHGKRSHKVTPFHELFLRSRAVRSLTCSVKAHDEIRETPPPLVLSPEVIATQALELLASVSATTHVLDTELWWNQY